MMKVKILGTGTSSGIPAIGCKCPVCSSTNVHDKRFRSSILIDINSTRILIDCGPDFRQQIMNEEFKKIDGILLTHEHFDHVGGIEDLRAYCDFGITNIFAEERCATAIERKLDYCFGQEWHIGIPHLQMNRIDAEHPFYINDVKITPIRVLHGSLPILGFRINDFVYITDMKTFPKEEWKKLQGTRIAIVNGLRNKPHRTHQTIQNAVDFLQKMNVEQGYITHLAHSAGLHDDVNKQLPNNISLAYDEQIIML